MDALCGAVEEEGKALAEGWLKIFGRKFIYALRDKPFNIVRS